MNSRLFSPSNGTIANLPDEMLLHILQELRARELITVGQVCAEGYRLANDNLLWIHRYQRDFGPLVMTEQAKAQYIAAYLFDQASKTPRADQAQLIYLQLFDFLYHHAGQAWALYYLGDMYYAGKGRPIDPDTGLIYLRISANEGDHKAICGLIHILKTQFNADTQTDLLQKLSLERCNEFLCLLKQRYQQGYKPAAPVIGYLYAEASNNRDQAIKWYETAIADGCAYAIRDLILEQDINEVFTYIDNLVLLHKENRAIAGELLYQKAQLYYEIGDDTSGLNALVEACSYGNIAANKDLGNIFRDIANDNDINQSFRMDTLQNAIECFTIGAQAFDSACTEGLFYCLMDLHQYDATSHETTIAHFKQLYAAGNSFATIFISKHFAFEFNALDPAHITWLQCAAQSNLEDSYFQLCSLSRQSDPSPFVFCALGILSQFGVLYSSFAERDIEKAQHYFERAHELDNTALSTYLDTMKAEGNANNEIMALLQNEIDLRASNQLCQASCRG